MAETLAQFRARATYHEGEYRAWPGELWGIELEVGDFLWGLVRGLRPELVLESGTGKGISSRFIARALQENRRGRLVTFEPDAGMIGETKKKLRGLPAEIRQGDTLSWTGPLPGVVFLDSHPTERRAAEIAYWLTHPVLLAIHDATRYELPPGLWLPTPRGLWVGLPVAVQDKAGAETAQEPRLTDLDAPAPVNESEAGEDA
jgi:hypothetical protein